MSPAPILNCHGVGASVEITSFEIHDLRFPTSLDQSGSDSMNQTADYSAAYIKLHTSDPSLIGHGFSFTIGRGNEVVCLAAKLIAERLMGKSLDELTSNMGKTWRYLVGDSQHRWIGPEKGAIHLGLSACVNAVWDLWGRQLGKPVWQIVTEMTPEEYVRCLDFRYIDDCVTPEDALAILKEAAETKKKRLRDVDNSQAVPAYTTQAGWIGYSDEKMTRLMQSMIDEGFDKFKMKVGLTLEEDMHRLELARKTLGPEKMLMVDANQVWGVQESIDRMIKLAPFKPYFIEEPTSPDDILGHATIRKALKPYGIKVATGEHCHNRVMFKQLLQAGSIDVCQVDACRLGGVNEVMAVLLMAKKLNVPVVPHSGGIGLNEYTQHLAIINYVSVAGEKSLLEHINSFHSAITNPVVVKDGYFVTPLESGYSVEYKPEAIKEYEYPIGTFWNSETGLKIRSGEKR